MLSTGIVLLLAFLPESLFYYSIIVRKQRHQRRQQQRSGKNVNKETHVYRLENIGCASCVATVAGALDKIDFVENYNISLDDGLLSVQSSIDVEESKMIIKSTLDEAGFTTHFAANYTSSS